MAKQTYDCDLCGKTLSKAYKHTIVPPVGILDWKDYKKTNEKVLRENKPGMEINYYCSYDSMINQECLTEEEE